MKRANILILVGSLASLIAGCKPPTDARQIRTAAAYGDLAFLQNMVTNSAQANLKLPGRHSHEYMFLLHVAALRGDVDLIDMVLQRGGSVDAQDHEGRTPLMFVMLSTNHSARSNAASRLINAGANLRIGDSDKSDALHYAVSSGDVQMVELLLKAGADVRTVDGRGFTPLHCVINKETAQLLVKHGADPNAKTIDGFSPADSARFRRVTEALEVLTNAP